MYVICSWAPWRNYSHECLWWFCIFINLRPQKIGVTARSVCLSRYTRNIFFNATCVKFHNMITTGITQITGLQADATRKLPRYYDHDARCRDSYGLTNSHVESFSAWFTPVLLCTCIRAAVEPALTHIYIAAAKAAPYLVSISTYDIILVDFVQKLVFQFRAPSLVHDSEISSNDFHKTWRYCTTACRIFSLGHQHEPELGNHSSASRWVPQSTGPQPWWLTHLNRGLLSIDQGS